MALDVKPIASRIRSHVKATRALGSFAGHEPTSAPGQGMTGGMWVERMGPVRSSGVASVSMRVIWVIRVYNPAFRPPLDALDPDVVNAVGKIQGRLIGDDDLGGLVRSIDIFGEHGVGMDGRAGYVKIDQTTYRCMDLVVPCIINDVFDEEE